MFPTHHRLPDGVGAVRWSGLTHTGPVRRQLEAGRALAAVAARNVDTVGVTLAQVVSAATLIDVYRGGGGGGRDRTSFTDRITVRSCSLRWTKGQKNAAAPF